MYPKPSKNGDEYSDILYVWAYSLFVALIAGFTLYWVGFASPTLITWVMFVAFIGGGLVCSINICIKKAKAR